LTGIGKDPFGLSPEPRFIYFGEKLRHDHEALLSVVRSAPALVVVCGGRGIGKTILLRTLAGELRHRDHRVVYKSCLGSPSLHEVVETFGGRPGRSQPVDGKPDGKEKAVVGDWSDVLQLRQTHAVLLLDDADGLTEESLRAVSALPGRTSKTGSTVSVILAGSAKLYSRLEQWSNSPDGQRIDLRVPLAALEPEDVAAYIAHRLRAAGSEKTQVFSMEAVKRITHYSKGNPQVINRICGAAMVVAAEKSLDSVPADIVDRVAPDAVAAQTLETIGVDLGRRQNTSEIVTTPEEIFTSSKLDIAPLLKHSGAPASPEPSDRPALRTGMNMGLGEASGTNWDRFHQAVPSGRDLTSLVSRKAEVAPSPRFRVPFGIGWAAAGVLSAIGGTALYLVFAGDAAKNPAPPSHTPATAAVQDHQEPSEQPDTAAPWLSSQWVEPPPNDSWRSPKSLDPAPISEGFGQNTVAGAGADRLPPESARGLDADRLKARGDGLLSIGDIASARLVYRLAALNGSAVAATAMGSTYDPTRLSKTAIDGGQANVEEAVRWYEKAIAMGEKSARFRLLNLSDSLENPPDSIGSGENSPNERTKN
jgi:general secretion pathway protein A